MEHRANIGSYMGLYPLEPGPFNNSLWKKIAFIFGGWGSQGEFLSRYVGKSLRHQSFAESAFERHWWPLYNVVCVWDKGCRRPVSIAGWKKRQVLEVLGLLDKHQVGTWGLEKNSWFMDWISTCFDSKHQQICSVTVDMVSHPSLSILRKYSIFFSKYMSSVRSRVKTLVIISWGWGEPMRRWCCQSCRLIPTPMWLEV